MSDSSIQQDKERAALLHELSAILHDHFRASSSNSPDKYSGAQMTLVQFIEDRDKEIEQKARINEVKHRYTKLILTDIDEFKWKEFAEKRIEEIKGDNNGNR